MIGRCELPVLPMQSRLASTRCRCQPASNADEFDLIKTAPAGRTGSDACQGAAARDVACRTPGVHDLHLGLDRQAEGRGQHHAALYNRLAWMQDAYGLTADDVVLQKTPFSFDVSVWEFFWPLMVGARLVMARRAGTRSGAAGRDDRPEGVTTLHFVPSMLQAFLEHVACRQPSWQAWAAASGDLQRRGAAGGAAGRVSTAICRRFAAQPVRPDRSLDRRDALGLRATTATGADRASDREHAGYVLDGGLEPVPAGVAGELYIAGVAWRAAI